MATSSNPTPVAIIDTDQATRHRLAMQIGEHAIAARFGR